MYKQRVNYVIVGAFVTAMLCAGAFALALLTGRTGPTERYYVLLDNVADVKFGTQVRYEGYPIGQVEDVAPVIDGAGMTFRVDVSVKRGWRIPDDSVARIGASSFLAAKTIDIESGDSTAAVAPGARIPSAPAIDIFSTINATAGEISQLNRESLTPLIDTLRSLAETVEDGGPRILTELTAFSEGLNASLTPLQRILARRNVEALERTIANMEETTANLAGISRGLTETAARVDSLAGNLDGLVADNRDAVDQSLEDVRYTLSAVSATVDAIVHNLDGTARNMNEFSRLIRQNPGLLLDATPRPAVSPAGATSGRSAGEG